MNDKTTVEVVEVLAWAADHGEWRAAGMFERFFKCREQLKELKTLAQLEREAAE